MYNNIIGVGGREKNSSALARHRIPTELIGRYVLESWLLMMDKMKQNTLTSLITFNFKNYITIRFNREWFCGRTYTVYFDHYWKLDNSYFSKRPNENIV